MASQTSDQVVYEISREIEKAKVLVQFPEVLGELEEANLFYGDLKKDISVYFREREVAWSKAVQDDPLTVKYRLNPAAVKLREFQNYGWLRYNDILITDKKGGVVATTGKPHDFYQADETWWRQTFDEGRGKIYIGGIQEDEDAKTLSFIIALPIWDWGHEHVIGAIKLALNTQELFSLFYEHRFGKTGSTVLVDEKGNVLLLDPLLSLVPKSSFSELASSPEREWSVLPWFRDKTWILGYAVLDFSEELVEDYTVRDNWFVATYEELHEALQPVYFLYWQMCCVAALLVLFTGFVNFYVARKITGPIQALNREAELVGGGDFDRKIDIHTNDEIEGLAQAFNRMVGQLKESYSELELKVKARTEQLEERTRALEKMNKFMLGREERMIELKKEIEYLKDEIKRLKTK